MLGGKFATEHHEMGLSRAALKKELADEKQKYAVEKETVDEMNVKFAGVQQQLANVT